jgi:hypothetical protein
MDENVERIQELINWDKCLCIHDLHEIFLMTRLKAFYCKI